MGIDYDANFGIGFEVAIGDGDLEDDLEVGDYIENLLSEHEHLGYSYFKVGSENYGGDVDEVYVTIDKPFKELAENAEDYEKQLLEFLESHKVYTIGEFGLVGGLRIW